MSGASSEGCSVTHRQQVLSTVALLQLCNRLVVRVYPTTQLFKDASLLRLPVPLLPLLQDAVELLLCLLSRLLDRRDEILFVSMTEVPRDIGVLEGLEGSEGGRCVQVRDLVCERGCIDASLREQVVSERKRASAICTLHTCK